MNCATVKYISVSAFVIAAIFLSVTKSESDLESYARELQELDPAGIYFGNGIAEDPNPEPLESEDEENGLDEEKRLRFYGAPAKKLRFYGGPEKRLRFYNPQKRLRFSSVDPTAKKRLRFTASHY